MNSRNLLVVNSRYIGSTLDIISIYLFPDGDLGATARIVGMVGEASDSTKRLGSYEKE